LPDTVVPAPRGLRQRAFSAGRWSLFGMAASQGIRLATTLVMTRLLVPSMFGVMAIVVMVYVIAGLLTDLGIRQNIVQRHGSEPAFLDTAWTVQILRGFVIWLMALVVAAGFWAAGHLGYLPAGTVYGAPILPLVLAVSTLAVVISGFQSTKGAIAERELDQRRLIRIDLASQLSAFVLMALVAWHTGSIWSLVIGQMFAALVSAVLSHVALSGHDNGWPGIATR
jgi:O-antigen/teichoic acid export membrane protein